MPEADDDNQIVPDFVPQFIVVDKQPAHLTRGEFLQPRAKPGIMPQQPRRRRPQRLNGCHRGRLIGWRQEFVKTEEVRLCS